MFKTSLVLHQFETRIFTNTQMSNSFYISYNHSFEICVLFFADDDSEPILGLWFEETISPTKDKVAPPPPPPPPPLETSPRLKSPSKQNQIENGNILAGRKDPELVRNTFYASLTKLLVWNEARSVELIFVS